jgi:ribonuclease J
VPYLLRERGDIPIVGSRFTLALLSAKLREHRIEPVLRPVAEEQTTALGPFELEFFAVNHSIPDALAVAIRSPAGIVLHTGDFKMDQLPLDGRLTDLGGFARLGREGIDLLLSDSTNAEVPGFVTPSARSGPVVDEVVRTSAGRVIVACFASHVHRVQQVLDAAHAHGRSVAFVGRSMVRNMGVARDLGFLRVPDGLMIDMKDVEHLPPARWCWCRRAPGRAAVRAVADGQPVAPPDPDRGGRHGGPGLLADPGQRERRLPGDQRAVPLGRPRGPQGRREGARLRARARR